VHFSSAVTTSAIHFLSVLAEYFVRFFITTVASFIYSLKCSLGYVEPPNKYFMTEVHEFYCAVLGGAVRKLSNKRSNIALCKNFDIVVSLNCENDAKQAKLANDIYIPTTLTTVSNNEDKIISDFLLSEYTRNQDTASRKS